MRAPLKRHMEVEGLECERQSQSFKPSRWSLQTPHRRTTLEAAEEISPGGVGPHQVLLGVGSVSALVPVLEGIGTAVVVQSGGKAPAEPGVCLV